MKIFLLFINKLDGVWGCDPQTGSEAYYNSSEEAITSLTGQGWQVYGELTHVPERVMVLVK
jgi:hypothetical protein